MKTSTKTGFELPDEIIIVKHIPRNTGMAANVDKNHVIAGGMLNTSTKKYCAPLQRNGTVKNILTDEEKEHLENLTGLNLSVYGDYWKTFFVTLYKESTSNIFNLSNPIDYISYKILMSLSKSEIAPSWQDRNKNLTYQFAITRENEEMLETKSKLDSKREAFMSYGKIMDSQEQLLGILKLLTNKPLSSKTSLDFLQHEVEQFVDKEPVKFLNVIKDKSLFTKLLINQAIDAKIISKKSNKYFTADGLELCNAGEIPTLENAVKYLENPMNQEIRDIIEAKTLKAK